MVADAIRGPRGDASGPTSFQPEGWEILFEPEGLAHLRSLAAAKQTGATDLALGEKLRKSGLPGAQVAALLTQVRLREKAQAKFGVRAHHLLFTQAGLEQASRMSVAAVHAARFAGAGSSAVADLGCGIGTESIAFLDAGISTLSVELDPFTARIAKHNLAVASEWFGVHAETPPRVLRADATSISLDGIDGVYLDPARRTSGHKNTRRISNPKDFSPSLDFAFSLGSRFPTGIKLGPGVDRELIPQEAEAQWVSVDGQLVEMGLWLGSVARPGVKRAALLLTRETQHELTAAEDSPDASTRPLGEFLYEPDGTVIRARLIGLLAEQIGAGMVNEGIAYLTSDSHTSTPFAQPFRIIERLPASEKQLRRELAARGIGALEIKKRGSDTDPAQLRRRLRLAGPNSATLFLTREAGKHVALLAERLSPHRATQQIVA